ncbi:RNA-dependent RNA polymerase [Caimito virus]|uniref:RNA-directed RNA polymerase L n=1 Tax=Caimito virus TaxID=2572766 RepID=A0A4P8D7R6_9VIRU|nr:RNA-dependent RNA polymerase [Caimito virus]QCI62735.1 RNA-dependent RNA polymerase [Caimito virus]QLA46978.1 L [Caimito virus] [Caimito virus]
MDQASIDQYVRRIQTAPNAEIALMIDTDLFEARHDYFGKELCTALGIAYRNDVPGDEIIMASIPEINPDSIRIKCTPDNYVIRDGVTFIIDYKVIVNDETMTNTYEKYTSMFEPYFSEFGRQFEVVVIACNPYTYVLKHTGVLFENFFEIQNLDLNFDWFFMLKDMLYERFKDDETFIANSGPGEFSMTAPWYNLKPELYNDNEYRNFLSTLPYRERELFEHAMDYDPFKADKWSDFLIQTKDKYKDEYNRYIKECARDIFSIGKSLEKPSHDEINQGWSQMYERVKEERTMISDPTKQKPSIHCLWSMPINKNPNDQISKITFFSKKLQRIRGNDQFSEVFRRIGENFDISEDTERYEKFCTLVKNESRLEERQRESKKVEPINIGTSKVLWEQQFKLDLDPIEKRKQSIFKKDFMGIGKGKRFAIRTEKDVDTDKPKMLDFEDQNVVLAAQEMMENTKGLLSRRNMRAKVGCFLDEYKQYIENCSKDTWQTVDRIASTNYWSMVNDYSILMRNILSSSQYNKHNTFRVCFCANNSIMAIVLPSSDIKTKQATTCFITLAFHQDRDDIFNPGCIYKTFETTGGFLTISRPVRLDKERCQRVVTAPGLFLESCILMYNNNPTIKLKDVMNFCLFTSLSITKPLLTLTEPSRYMIMNSLAVTSSVKGYIGEKFNPMTKTLFSVYMAKLIKSGCSDAFNQKDLIQPRRVALDDYDITQKGVEDVRNFKSIWFPGKVSLKEYINQIYLPFYFNAKGLHEKHHVMIDLAKTVLEIESDQRRDDLFPWSDIPKPQSVNLPVLIYGTARQLHLDTQRKAHLRMKIENRNNFKRKMFTISTLTSSKSCIERGDFKAEKSHGLKRNHNIANPLFEEEFEENIKVEKSNYLDLISKIPNYIDIRSTKVFDVLYKKSRDSEIGDDEAITYMMESMMNKEEYVFSFFNKGQKTAKDREIFVGEYEAKMSLYVIERIMKELCKSNPEEMISEPGDGKLKVLETMANQEIRSIISISKRNKGDGNVENKRPLKIDINADMSKWSAQDVTYKYFWLIALNPILYPEEKSCIIKFLCRYMNKKLILPDSMISSIFDQFKYYEHDIIRDMTNDYRQNWVQIRNNWFQGNLNYTSSYIHTVSMSAYKDIIKTGLELLEGDAIVSSLVHSDDNHTSIIVNQGKLENDDIVRFCYDSFVRVCLTHGNQVNKKKTYVTNGLKEFVSLFNIFGEPFSVYGRFLLTSVGDCAYLGPYEDLSSRISSVQTAIKHGCPPSYAWVAVAMSQWLSYSTYNMLPGQYNDPCEALMIEDRFSIPIELGGLIGCPLHILVLLGLDSINVYNLYKIVKSISPIGLRGNRIEELMLSSDGWILTNITREQEMQLKVLRYITLGVEIDSASKMGETSDMRNRSVLTPRKFTTRRSLIRLESYKDYSKILQSQQDYDANLQYMLNHPELLVTKGECSEDYNNTVLFRYNSKRFKESLSIQNPSQLFIEQVLFSKKPTIDYTRISDKFTPGLERDDGQIIGKKTIKQALEAIRSDLNLYTLSVKDIETVFHCIVVNDPLAVTAMNTEILHVLTEKKPRNGLTCSTMPEFRNIKLINYSPAVVIRALVKPGFCPPTADPQLLERDIWFLSEFIKETGIKERAEEHIRLNELAKGSKDMSFEIQEWTRFYQSCYSYIKATEHKVKMFIIPNKAVTATQFCQAIIGNLRKDDSYFGCYFQKNAIGYNQKGAISKTFDLITYTADECFRLLCHFTDQVVSPDHRLVFVNKIINTYKFRGSPVSYLLEKILNSTKRTGFLPLLLRLGEITENDLLQFHAEMSQRNVTWNNWQISRALNTGPVDLNLTTSSSKLIIRGQDSKLDYARLTLQRITISSIRSSGRNLLSAKHGLPIEMFEQCEIFERSWYICSQRRNNKRVFYDIKRGFDIKNENDLMINNQRRSQMIIPHCEVEIVEDIVDQSLDFQSVIDLNYNESSFSKIAISESVYATTRKIDLTKMQDFEGPDIISNKIDISKLMKSSTLLSCNYDKVVASSLIELSSIMDCSGINTEMSFDFLNDEPMEADEFESIEATPNMLIQYGKKGQSYMTLQNAFHEIIKVKAESFKRTYTFAGGEFFSKENMAIWTNLISLFKTLEIEGECTQILQTIHLILAYYGFDSMFHLAEISPEFMNGEQINYKHMSILLNSLKCNGENLWSYLFNKASIVVGQELRKREMSESVDINSIIQSISRRLPNMSEFNFQSD